MEVEALKGSHSPRRLLPGRRLRLVWGLAALLLPGLAQASLMLPLTVEELSDDSELVAIGRVVRTEARRSERSGRIYTLVTFEVGEAWKGEPVERVELRIPGGTLDGISQQVMGVPHFEAGEEAVVFLRGLVAAPPAASLEAATPPDAPMLAPPPGALRAQVVGMAQGKLSVRTDEVGVKIAAPDLRGLELYDPAAGKVVAPPAPLSIGALKARVQAADR